MCYNLLHIFKFTVYFHQIFYPTCGAPLSVHVFKQVTNSYFSGWMRISVSTDNLGVNVPKYSMMRWETEQGGLGMPQVYWDHGSIVLSYDEIVCVYHDSAMSLQLATHRCPSHQPSTCVACMTWSRARVNPFPWTKVLLLSNYMSQVQNNWLSLEGQDFAVQYQRLTMGHVLAWSQLHSQFQHWMAASQFFF